MEHKRPDGLNLVRTTPVFDETTAPQGLRRTHRIAEGVWGRLKVLSGRLRFVVEDESDVVNGETSSPIGDVVVAGDAVDIAPGQPHHVVLDESVSFVVEFYK